MSPPDIVLPGTVAVLLVLGITWWVRRTEVHRRETAALVAGAVLAGVAAGIGSRLVLPFFLAVLASGDTGDGTSVMVMLVAGIVIVALVEQGAKMAAIAVFYRHMDETENGIVYGVAAGCGFAVSGIALMPFTPETWASGVLPGLIITVPVIAVIQTVTGGMIGLGLARAFPGKGTGRVQALVWLFGGAVLVHALLLGVLAAQQAVEADNVLSLVLSCAVLLYGLLVVAILFWLDRRVRLYDIGGMVQDRALR